MEPVIKVRYKSYSKGLITKLSFSFLLLTTVVMGRGMGAFPKCDKTPKETVAPKIEGSNGYAVAIVGSPLKYRPNQVYKISLKNTDDVEEIRKFQSFLLVTEPTMEIPADREVSLGSFQLIPGDAMVKFSHRCSNAVEATSSISKESVSVLWQAPPPHTGCIDFKAMIEERQDVWYSDDDLLTYTLCEDDSPMAEPPMVEPCCACNEAKYELIFEGVWSRHTHPKDFPPNEWRTEFSPIIGASHSVNYSLWEISRHASPSLALLGENGYTANLEKDMKIFSPHIRSVIKAHGLEQRSNVVHQTFAVFRVDPVHHLVSIVSKMIPSPDWIVGLSKENICLANCSWVANRVIDLYPWDIGTQSGVRYDSPDMPTRPRGRIQRITSSNPSNPESPFYDQTFAPIKPVARIHLIRQREYIKDCPPGKGRPRPRDPNPLNSINAGQNLWNSDTNRINNMAGSGIYPEADNTNVYNNYGFGSNNNPGGYPNLGGDSNNNMGGYSTNQASENSNQYGGVVTETDPYQFPDLNQSPGYNGNSYVYGEGIGAPLDTERYGFTNDQSNYNYERVNENNDNNNNYNNPNTGYDPYGTNVNEDNRFGMVSPDDGEIDPGYDTSLTYNNIWDNNANNVDNNPYGTTDQNSINGMDVCAVRNWGNWDECSATCGSGSQNRMREYVNTIEASMNNCQEPLLDKRPCFGLPECQGVSYGSQDNSFPNPFNDDQANIGYNWQGRGIQSDGLVSKNPLSYSYETGMFGLNQNGMQYQNENQMYGNNPYGSTGTSMRSGNNYGTSYFYGERDANGVLDTPSYSSLNQNLQGDSTVANCEVTSWGRWSDCNTDCGHGIRTRSRRYSDPLNSATCSEELDDEDGCYGNSDSCIDGKSSYEPAEDPRLTKWHAQSTFDVQDKGSPSNENMRTRVNSFDARGNGDACEVAEWSQWSPCSKKCGKGRRQRTRLFTIPFVPDRNCDVRLIDSNPCMGQDPICGRNIHNFDNNDDNQDFGYEMSDFTQADEERNDFLVKPLNLRNSNNFAKQWTSSDKRSSCHLDPDPGPCNGHFSRWHYDLESGSCKIFSFRGCQGNSNNFATKDKCMKTCAPVTDFSSSNTPNYELFGQSSPYTDNTLRSEAYDPFRQLKSLSSVKVADDEDHFNIGGQFESEKDLTPVDCVVSAWTDWSHCSVSCGTGWITRQRNVLVGPKNEGRPCPKKLARRRRCQREICQNDTKYWYRGSWRHMVSNDDIRPN